MANTETLSKLFLELDAALPDTHTKRELDAAKQRDKFGVALRMISSGCDDPRGLATRVLKEEKQHG